MVEGLTQSSSFPLDPGTSTPTHDPKGKATVGFTVNRPNFVFKPKVVLGPHPKEASMGFKEPQPNPK
jgi:hypothetical protein